MKVELLTPRLERRRKITGKLGSGQAEQAKTIFHFPFSIRKFNMEVQQRLNHFRSFSDLSFRFFLIGTYYKLGHKWKMENAFTLVC